jgi:hypothetical protein
MKIPRRTATAGTDKTVLLVRKFSDIAYYAEFLKKNKRINGWLRQ